MPDITMCYTKDCDMAQYCKRKLFKLPRYGEGYPLLVMFNKTDKCEFFLPDRGAWEEALKETHTGRMIDATKN